MRIAVTCSSTGVMLVLHPTLNLVGGAETVGRVGALAVDVCAELGSVAVDEVGLPKGFDLGIVLCPGGIHRCEGIDPGRGCCSPRTVDDRLLGGGSEHGLPRAGDASSYPGQFR
jgi:hypothetical protein